LQRPPVPTFLAHDAAYCTRCRCIFNTASSTADTLQYQIETDCINSAWPSFHGYA